MADSTPNSAASAKGPLTAVVAPRHTGPVRFRKLTGPSDPGRFFKALARAGLASAAAGTGLGFFGFWVIGEYVVDHWVVFILIPAALSIPVLFLIWVFMTCAESRHASRLFILMLCICIFTTSLFISGDQFESQLLVKPSMRRAVAIGHEVFDWQREAGVSSEEADREFKQRYFDSARRPYASFSRYNGGFSLYLQHGRGRWIYDSESTRWSWTSS